MVKIGEDLPAIGGHPRAICMRLAANRNSVRLAARYMLNLHATSGHPAAICDRVAARPIYFSAVWQLVANKLNEGVSIIQMKT
jgi:S-adenosylhomocysteine hydrolase